MKKRVGFGFVTVSPSEYIIHIRGGKIIHKGLGSSVFVMPRDRYCIIPSTASNIAFKADQITRENQGVEISGFAIWKISEPEKIYLHFDFSSEQSPIPQINDYLKDVVESAIRHQIANMTIEDVLRKRGTIILQLKKELEYISGQWGVTVDTVEIKNVRVMSATLFGNMQAKYRDAVRLESETSSLSTEKEIAEQKLTQQNAMAIQQQEFKRKELERKAELDKLTLASQLEMKIQEVASRTTLLEREEVAKQQQASMQLKTLEAEQTLLDAQRAKERLAHEHGLELKRQDNEFQKAQIEVTNSESTAHLLYKVLPQVAGALKVSQLNIGQETLQSVLTELSKVMNPALPPVK